MPIVKKVHLLLAHEILSLTAIITAALTSVMFLFRLLTYSEYIFASSEGLLSIFMFVVFLFPTIFKLTIPLSLFVGTTIAVARMAQDREMEAWMSFGTGVGRLTVAPLAIGSAAAVLSLSLALFLEPMARKEFLKYKWMYARRNVEQVIESRLHPRTFISEPFEGGNTDICLFVDWLSENRRDFKGVFLAVQTKKERFASVLVAESGGLRRELKEGFFDYVFTLRNGRMYEAVESEGTMADASRTLPLASLMQVEAKSGAADIERRLRALPSVSWRVVRFSEFDISLVSLFNQKFQVTAPDANDMRTKMPREYLAALRESRESDPKWRKNRDKVRNHTFFYEQFAIPFACLLLPLAGLALGVHDPRRKMSHVYVGIGLCIFLFYASVMAGQQIPLAQKAPPELMLVLPPVVLVLMTTVLLRMRLRYPPSVGFKEYLGLVILGWHNRIRKLLGMKVRG
jgi:lipopolysaccharide export LptBFGC system permease protein LptF